MIQTESEILRLIGSKVAQDRPEGEIIPEGLSVTKGQYSTYWYYREGNMLAKLRTEFSIEHA
jgi:hypothetical protein